MASLLYNSMAYDEATGALDFDTDTFYAVLVNATYAAIADETKRDTHLKRSSVTANEVSGTGYTAGGAQTTVTVAKDTTTNKITVTFGQVVWSNATITAYGAVIYKRRGGADTADELVLFVDFGGAISSTNAAFTLQQSTYNKQL